jgi:hypothetical protein
MERSKPHPHFYLLYVLAKDGAVASAVEFSTFSLFSRAGDIQYMAKRGKAPITEKSSMNLGSLSNQ